MGSTSVGELHSQVPVSGLDPRPAVLDRGYVSDGQHAGRKSQVVGGQRSTQALQSSSRPNQQVSDHMSLCKNYNKPKKKLDNSERLTRTQYSIDTNSSLLNSIVYGNTSQI